MKCFVGERFLESINGKGFGSSLYKLIIIFWVFVVRYMVRGLMNCVFIMSREDYYGDVW